MDSRMLTGGIEWTGEGNVVSRNRADCTAES
jgi:hypothetical protein